RKGQGWPLLDSPRATPETNKDQSVHPWVRNIMGRLKSLGLLPSKTLPSLNKSIDRHRLSGFLYNISLYLQEMGAELEEAPAEPDEQQLWEKVLHFLLQSEGSTALNQTVSAVLEAALQALVSGTYGQASAGLQGFICALKGRNDCAFSVSWLQQVLRFLETRNWKPVVSLHPAGGEAEHNKGSGGQNVALVQGLDGLRRGLLHRVGSSVYGNLRRKVSRVTMALLDDVSTLVDVPQPSAQSRCSVGEFVGQLDLGGCLHNKKWQGVNVRCLFFLFTILFSRDVNVFPFLFSQAAVTKDYHFFNQTSIDELCVQLSGGAIGSPELDESCLAQLGSRSLSAQAFRHCFLPNNSVLIAALCDRESPDSQPSLPDASWAAAYCSKVLNLSHADAIEESCQYREWAAHRFTNTTLLELCGQTPGLREYMCLNTSLYNQLLRSVPQFDDFCADLEAELEGRKCFLQRFFDMLPAPYEFDTSQLCVDPAPLLVDIFHKLSVCEVEGGEREGFLVALGYVLRVLDFMVGLSSGLDEGEGEARKGLGQAILLSSLLDNTSWTALRPEASTSVLRTVGVFLRPFIHKFPRVTPELFVDLSQFIPFMSVSDIMSFPASLIINDTV
uniref:Stereocilin n=1 Tax=Scophthalmus maximus TaxID=52904 RepID=A0A8D3DD85_SCOMX